MSSSELPRVRRGTRGLDEGERRAHRRDRAAGVGEGRDRLGALGDPESQLDVLGDVAGLDVVELGCGTAYFSAWLAARRAAGRRRSDAGAARDGAAAAAEFGLEFPLLEGSRSVPLPGRVVRPRPLGVRRLDLGDPYRWIPEAARLLRPAAARLPAQLDALVLCSGSTRRQARRCSGRSAGSTGSTGGRGVGVPAPARRADRLLRASGFEVERLSSCTRPTTPRRTATTTSSRRVGAAWPPRRSGGRASGELARGRADPARVDEPAAARDPRAARDPVRRRRARLRGARPAGRRPGRPRPRARAREGALGRHAGAGERPVLGVDTSVWLDGTVYGKPATRPRPSGCSSSWPGRRTRSSPASAC